jgi:apolipoprotein N-acyltransferase
MAVLSGLLLTLSFPKFGHGLVAFVALTPLLVALRGVSSGRALCLGYISGAVWALGTVYWTAFVVVQYGGLSLPVGVAIMVILCLAVALFPALFAWVVGRWLAALGPPALLAAPVAWVATEILRAHTFFRFPWCLLGYSQHDRPALIQLAAYSAVYGISFLVAGVSGGVAYLLVEGRARPRRHVALALAALVLGVWAHGTWVVSRPLPEAPLLRVGLVQGNVLQDNKWDPAKAWENVGHHLELTRRTADAGARLVVWPESSLPFDFDRSPDVAAGLRELVRRRGLYLLFGNDDRGKGPAGEERVWVGAKMLTPTGELPFRYHKIRLVPFGEYVPLRPLLTLGGRFAAKLVQQVADFTPGEDFTLGEVDGHRIGTFICYEAIFPGIARSFVARGAGLLVNITNDAWYGRTSAPYQHLAMAKLRAVENGVFLVRAANTGITAIIDPRGRVVARTGLFERTALVGDVPVLSGGSFYSRHGDLLPWACLAAALIATATTLRRH